MSSAETGRDDPDDFRVDPLEWPTFDPSGYWGRARRRDRILASLFVVFLLPAVTEAVRVGSPVAWLAPLAACYGTAYLAVWWLATRWPPAGRIALVVTLFVLGIGYLVVEGNTSPGVLGYALSGSVMLLPLGWAQWIGMACIAFCPLASWLHAGRPDWLSTVMLALIAVITLSLSRIVRIAGKLQAARSEIRELAVAGERARLARDLHDVLGHSLTTITVKTSLSRRLLESGAPADRVLTEIRDTEELSRRALADIRATVSDQRRMSLAAELVSARAALRAAGIEADLPHAVDDVAPGLEEPLAYVLREGVTNVIRHSGASRCTVRLAAHWLEVVDDGPPGAEPPGAPGNGLAGLAERMAAVHGTVTAAPLPAGGYRLRAEVPR
ncbi:sensor histidine kinase, partial [Pseudonocardia acaciae]|uniref:sensor histidine kinase n=1 Tax=Pseudonocardia acaciae TaxID=551276 RepID=UPI000561D597